MIQAEEILVAAQMTESAGRERATVTIVASAKEPWNVETATASPGTPLTMTAVKNRVIQACMGASMGIAAQMEVHVRRERGIVTQTAIVLVPYFVEATIASAGTPWLEQRLTAVRKGVIQPNKTGVAVQKETSARRERATVTTTASALVA